MNVKLQIRRSSLSTILASSSEFSPVTSPSNSDSDVILKTLEELHREKTSSSDTVALAEIVRDESGAAGPHEQRYLLKV
jgi:hypothetical protein